MVQAKSRLATRQNYNRLSRWYDSFSGSERALAQTGLLLLDARLGENVLEIGFGTGHALLELARAVGESGSAHGIDLSSGMFAVADRRIQRSGMGARVSLHLGDASQLPFSAHEFQAIFMSFTLELFETTEIPVVLAECIRVLAPGGRLGVVSLVKKDTRAVKIYEWFHTQFPHIIDCQPILIQAVLEAAGFVVVQVVEKKLWGLSVEAIVAMKP